MTPLSRATSAFGTKKIACQESEADVISISIEESDSKPMSLLDETSWRQAHLANIQACSECTMCVHGLVGAGCNFGLRADANELRWVLDGAIPLVILGLQGIPANGAAQEFSFKSEKRAQPKFALVLGLKLKKICHVNMKAPNRFAFLECLAKCLAEKKT